MAELVEGFFPSADPSLAQPRQSGLSQKRRQRLREAQWAMGIVWVAQC